MAEGGYFSFHTLVSTILIKSLYIFGMIIVTLAGIFMIAQAAGAFSPTPFHGNPDVSRIVLGFIVILGGNILWRVFCEGWILLFSIHELLVSINRKTPKP